MTNMLSTGFYGFLLQFTFVFFLQVHPSLAQTSVPELWGQRVHDEAHVLTQETIDQLEKKLIIFEDSTSNQIAILIIQSLDGQVLEEYTLRVAEKWKLGTKSKDNGVLILVAVDDHKMRIEVGQGLQGVLTDALCNRIIRNEVAPAFRRNNYDEGVMTAIVAITKSIKGEYHVEEEAAEDKTGWIIFGVIFGLFCIGALVHAFAKEWRDVSNYQATGKSDTSRGSKDSSRVSSGSSSFSSSSGSSRSSFSGGGGSFDGGGSSGSW